MSPFTFRPAKRVNTPLIVGLAGPTKSGKTFSAHRLAIGLANGGTVAMINAEGAKGHQYSDRFTYLAGDITAPFRPEAYTEALKAALALEPRPAVVIIDSLSHMHDGPGGVLEYHEDELDRLAGSDLKKRERSTWSAWVKPKAAENEFIYTMLSADCHLILCFRAKEKIKIVTGKDPIDLGWQPIAGERVAFETIFTLVLPPHSKGMPDLAISAMREPFDTLVKNGRQLDEETGRVLAEWAGGKNNAQPAQPDTDPSELGRVQALESRLVTLLGLLDVDGGEALVRSSRESKPRTGHVRWLKNQIARAEARIDEGGEQWRATPSGNEPIASGTESASEHGRMNDSGADTQLDTENRQRRSTPATSSRTPSGTAASSESPASNAEESRLRDTTRTTPGPSMSSGSAESTMMPGTQDSAREGADGSQEAGTSEADSAQPDDPPHHDGVPAPGQQTELSFADKAKAAQERVASREKAEATS